MTRNTLLAKLLFCVVILASFLAGETVAQQPLSTPGKRNYLSNPKGKSERASQKQQSGGAKKGPEIAKLVDIKSSNENPNIPKPDVSQDENVEPANVENVKFQNAQLESRSVANKTLDVVKRATNTTLLPTEIYKVGVGDILFISLQNAPAKESSYFTVLKDGTIDYPLAGEMISVLSLTTEEIQSALQEKIKLYENPQVLVKVREHNSHAYTVLGMAEKTGERNLQREAVPLFVVRAEANVKPEADRAVIKRVNAQTETIDLKDKKYEEVLIFPGDIVEFDSAKSGNAFGGQPQFYYIAGQVMSGGQKDFYRGITLSQAIIVSGGLKKADVKKVIIRRKNEQGLLVPLPFDLKAIREGKFADPMLEAGDTIEVGN